DPRSPFPSATPSSSKNAALSVGRFASCQGLKSTTSTSDGSDLRTSMTIFLMEDFPLPQAPYNARTRLSRPDHPLIARASASENMPRPSTSSLRRPIGLSGENSSDVFRISLFSVMIRRRDYSADATFEKSSGVQTSR